MIARVAIDGTSSGRLFDYFIPADLEKIAFPGSRVRLQFGKRPATGYIVEIADGSTYLNKQAENVASANAATDILLPGLNITSEPKSLRQIDEIDGDRPVILPSLIQLAQWMSWYYYAPIERCIQTLLPAPVRSGRGREKVMLYVDVAGGHVSMSSLTERQRELFDNLKRVGGGWMQQVCKEFKCSPAILRKMRELGAVTIEEKTKRRDPFANKRVLPSKPLALNEGQSASLASIRAATDSAGTEPPKPVLLFGVTGSGKTEVYLQAIASVLAQGRGAIVLVPEIALTPQTVQRFRSRFGDDIAVLHSGLSDGERYDEWQRIRNGKAGVVVGPRSAVFAPVENLGLIVVDEEHEPSYKQDESPRYNARDVAVMRAHIEKCAVVLGSATPSLESWKNVKIGKYVLARLPKRAMIDSVMPLVHIVDMRREISDSGQVRLFSKTMLDAIQERLNRGEQTILFLNRRGYSTSLVCPSCGYVATCQACDVAYTYHKSDDCLRCHICGDWRRPSDKCPQCGDPKFKYAGFGTQRVEQIITRCFPHAAIARMDADSTSRKLSHDEILAEFRAGKTDILIGTQMIAKGLHFPNVTLVGIVMADSSLHIPDFRAGERTFQLLAQVAGRTGRGAIAGEVIVQTYTPEHPAVQMARTENFEGFADIELPVREELGYPPYVHLSCITLTGPDEAVLSHVSEKLAETVKHFGSRGLLVSDSCAAALAKANNAFRYQILLRAPAVSRMIPAITAALKEMPIPDLIHVAVDIDAMSML